jgi:hypothetical protein
MWQMCDRLAERNLLRACSPVEEAANDIARFCRNKQHAANNDANDDKALPENKLSEGTHMTGRQAVHQAACELRNILE